MAHPRRCRTGVGSEQEFHPSRRVWPRVLVLHRNQKFPVQLMQSPNDPCQAPPIVCPMPHLATRWRHSTIMTRYFGPARQHPIGGVVSAGHSCCGSKASKAFLTELGTLVLICLICLAPGKHATD